MIITQFGYERSGAQRCVARAKHALNTFIDHAHIISSIALVASIVNILKSCKTWSKRLSTEISSFHVFCTIIELSYLTLFLYKSVSNEKFEFEF